MWVVIVGRPEFLRRVNNANVTVTLQPIQDLTIPNTKNVSRPSIPPTYIYWPQVWCGDGYRRVIIGGFNLIDCSSFRFSPIRVAKRSNESHIAPIVQHSAVVLACTPRGGRTTCLSLKIPFSAVSTYLFCRSVHTFSAGQYVLLSAGQYVPFSDYVLSYPAQQPRCVLDNGRARVSWCVVLRFAA